MKAQYELTIKGIDDWFEDSLKPFKQYGDVKQLLNEASKNGQEVISYNVDGNGRGYIRCNQKELDKKKKVLLIYEYRNTLLIIKNEIQKYYKLDDYHPDAPSDGNQIIETIGKLWQTLPSYVQGRFVNPDLPKLTQPIVKKKPESNGKLIMFKNSEIIKKTHLELKGFFPNKEAELLKVLQGEELGEMLLFPHNQNKFVEVFRRVKYNGFLLNSDTEIVNWICDNFQFIKKGYEEPQSFKKESVWDIINKGKGEPTKKARICITELLPYKSPTQLKREKKE